MKVLIIARTFHPPYATGYTAYCKGLLHSILKLRDIEVSLVSTMRSRKYLRSVIKCGALVKTFKEFKVLSSKLNMCSYLEEQVKNKFINTYSLLRETSNIVKRHEYDFIHDLAGIKILPPASHFKKIVIFEHIITPAVRVQDKIYSLLLNIIGINKVLAFSSKYIAESYGYDNRNYAIIPPAIDTNLYRPLAISEPDGFDYRILYIGPLTVDRFPYIILKSIYFLRGYLGGKIKLNIILADWRKLTEKYYREIVLRYVDRLGIKENVSIIYKTLDEYEKVRTINMHDTVIYILRDVPKTIVPVDPPITPLEAMSCGKPVIVSDVMSLRSIVKHGVNGYIAKASSWKSIAKALYQALTEGKKVGLQARETIVRLFSIDKITGILEKLYKNFIRSLDSEYSIKH